MRGATSRRCRPWPTPFRKPGATTPASSTTAGGRVNTSGAVGWLTSSYQKTAEASAYHCPPAPPTISVAALLRLAQWCQHQRRTHGGSPPCPTPLNPPSPPAPNDGGSTVPAALDAADGPA